MRAHFPEVFDFEKAPEWNGNAESYLRRAAMAALQEPESSRIDDLEARCKLPETTKRVLNCSTRDRAWIRNPAACKYYGYSMCSLFEFMKRLETATDEIDT